ncbi:MAG: response regulator transcription factor [Erysipelotrichaceae bacterium]|nr:response regulator transcription factor [Erysipelotrichaceae bacterium]
MSYRLLIVEDSLELLEAMSDFYREEGAGIWEVVTASDGNDALAKVTSDIFDLMILDIMLPGVSGFEICKAARKRDDCPIVFVTALGSETNILKGYETGCDDYVVKPFSLRHLYAKSLALLKRAKKNEGNDQLRCGSISLDKKTMLIKVSNREISINAKEYFLLVYLLENKGSVLTRRDILEHVWGNELDVNDRVVDTTIKRLRASLGDAAGQIKTVIGRGYRITEER